MNKKGILLFLLAVVCTISVNAQSHKGLRISEVMVENDSNYVDEYGKCQAWVELYNTTRRAMNVSSIYLTTERFADGETPDRSKMYFVPRGDHNTKVGHLSTCVFFADGTPEKGTFHTCLTFTPGEENYLAVYDADGITKLDEVVIPANLGSNQSYARDTKIEDFIYLEGGDYDQSQWSIHTGKPGSEITPGENNYVIGANNKIEQFEEKDGSGVILTVMAMAIVFSALILLAICFFIFGSINNRIANKKANEEAGAQAEATTTAAPAAANANEEVIAAISMALYQHFNAHDEESNVLTLKSRESNWNQRIATITQQAARR